MSISRPKMQSGFTLVELVMVIILIGVLSYGAGSLFASRDAYSAYIAKDQLISVALLGQQVALGMGGAAAPARLQIGVDGSGDWEMTLTKEFNPAITTDDIRIERLVESTGGSLQIDGVTIASGGSVTFTWDSDGNLTDGNNHQIRFIGDTTHQVCISAQGYAYDSVSACP